MSKTSIRFVLYFVKLVQVINARYYRWILDTPQSVDFLGRIRFINPDKIKIGENVRFNEGVFLNIGERLVIEEGATFSANVFVTDTTSDTKKLPKHVHVRSPVFIGKNTWIGAGAIILPGVEIGQGCVIAAGAVLSQSTGENEIWIGNPARKAGNLK